MIVLDKKILVFHSKEVHFSDYPFDIDNCDYLKFHFCKKKADVKGFKRQNQFTSIIDLTQDLDTIWQNMDRKQTRYGIKKAQREEIKVKKSNDFDKFFQIYNSFTQKKGIKSLFDVFGVGRISIEDMRKYGTLFLAELDGDILAANLYLIDHSICECWISVSRRLDSDLRWKKILIGCASRLITWEAIKYAKDYGVKEFDLGGLWSREEAEKDVKKRGINSFKLSFGGEVVHRYYYEKIYSKSFNVMYNLYSLFNGK